MLVFLVAILGFLGVQPEEVDQPFVVVTSNIRYDNPGDGEDQWSKRRSFLVNELRAMRPDVLCLQEALDHQLSYVEAALEDFDRVGVGRDDGERKGEYAPILVRRDRFSILDQGTFWLSDSPETPGSASWGNTIPRICTWVQLEDEDGRTFRVFNVHLDHRSGESRRRASALLVERMGEEDDPVILAGDFNEAPDGAIMPYLTGASETPGCEAPVSPGLVDAWRAMHEEGEAGTFNGFDPSRTGSRIDHILVDPSLQVLECEVLRPRREGRCASDHDPVRAVIRF